MSSDFRWKALLLVGVALGLAAYFSISMRNFLTDVVWNEAVCPFLGWAVGICSS